MTEDYRLTSDFLKEQAAFIANTLPEWWVVRGFGRRQREIALNDTLDALIEAVLREHK